MIRDDYILALIERIAELLAAALGREVAGEAELDDACQELVGLPLPLVEQLSHDALLDLLGDAAPAQRAGLGMMLIARGEHLIARADPAGFVQLDKGLRLAGAAAAQLQQPPPALIAAIARAGALTNSGS
jgi:GNAT superfamily N-acetyltransferase